MDALIDFYLLDKANNIFNKKQYQNKIRHYSCYPFTTLFIYRGSCLLGSPNGQILLRYVAIGNIRVGEVRQVGLKNIGRLSNVLISNLSL
jgi:hypothetical protein